MPFPVEVSLPSMPDLNITYAEEPMLREGEKYPCDSRISFQHLGQHVNAMKDKSLQSRISAPRSRSKSDQKSPLLELPVNVILKICYYLRLRDFVHFSDTCRYARLLRSSDDRSGSRLGKDLVGDLLLQGGLDACDRHR